MASIGDIINDLRELGVAESGKMTRHQESCLAAARLLEKVSDKAAKLHRAQAIIEKVIATFQPRPDRPSINIVMLTMRYMAREGRPLFGAHLGRGEPLTYPYILKMLDEGLAVVSSDGSGYVLTERGKAMAA